MPCNNLTVTNRFIEQLPGDPETDVYPRQVNYAAYSFVNPTKVRKPTLVAYSEEVATMLGFTQNDVNQQSFVDVFTGNILIEGMQPYALCYGGHQFGHWAGQLGDGRAINLGEVTTKNAGHQILQLKGAGLTPYSRTADGLAVLRSSVREFLCSEAMHHLGIPTTRALSLTLTGEQVMRDMFYNGEAKLEPGAVVCRVSSSFMRFGNFQLPAQRGEHSLLTQLVDYSITTDFPHLGSPNKSTYLRWFEEICQRTCSMVVNWMRVGFVHGVMNTDNMSILGETIDYGPYGWLDNFDLNWTPNTTDAQNRRYRFGAQGQISQWNLFQLANAIYPLIQDAKPLQVIIDNYAVQYQELWQKMMYKKLGLKNIDSTQAQSFLSKLESLLCMVDTDMTVFYRQLAKLPMEKSVLDDNAWLDVLLPCYYAKEQLNENYLSLFSNWLNTYIKLAITGQKDFDSRMTEMNQVNPKYVLRNYLAQQAIESAEKGDYSEIHRLQKILQHPYDEQPEYEKYAQIRPDWAKEKAGCSMLSCSS
ncbi:YdiU family protein [Colwelliaceae bacterium 6471]